MTHEAVEMSPLVAFFSDTMTWYSLAVLLFFVFIYIWGRKPILGAIDGEIAKIRDELEQAKKLRAEAAATLEDYRVRQKEAIKEAEAIIAHARDESVRLRALAARDLEDSLKRRERSAMQRILVAENEALAEVRQAVIDQALAAARTAMAAHLDAAALDRLAEQAIADVPKLGVKNKAA